MIAFTKNRAVLIVAVAVSLMISLLRVLLLHGTFAALAITVMLQVYLPGYLLARVLGKHTSPHPIVRFVWMLAGGLALPICIGAVARFLSLSVPVYLLILHAIMLLLALRPASAPTESNSPWQWNWQKLPLYVLVAASCAVAMGVSYESRNRFYGFEDQGIFISLIDWIATHPDVRPHDTPIRTRQIGVLPGDPRMDTDGWTYVHASWVWTSGVSAAQLIWYDLGTLFIWTIPLVHFVLAYELTKRDSAAAWTTAALTLAALMTLDNIVYNPGYTAYGRFALFQINVNRQASLALVLPLSLLAWLTYLKTLHRRDLVMALLSGMALASMHPIPTTILVASIGVTAFLKWLAAPRWSLIRKMIPLGVGLLFLMALPFIQRFSFFGLSAAPGLANQTDSATLSVRNTDSILVLPNLPLLGQTYIRRPSSVFYSPVIAIAVAAGLLFGLRWRRSVAAQYIFGTTALGMLLFFMPGLTELVDRFGSFITLLVLIFILPVSLALGLGVDACVNWVSQRLPARFTQAGFSLAAILGMFILLFEPIPIYASARDQLNAYNTMQGLRLLHPSQIALADSLRAHIPQNAITVFVTPYDVANVVIEELSGSLITSGRNQGVNTAAQGNERFYTDSTPAAPWLDSTDLKFLQQFGVTHIIMLAFDTRTTQLLLQPERFQLLDSPEGYLVFQIYGTPEVDRVDELFQQMDMLYGKATQPRWGRDGFNLILPGDSASWGPIAEQWQRILSDDPQNDRASLGLAFTYTMMGADADALAVWQELHETYPDVPLYADALASTLQQLNPTQDSIAPLIDALSGSNDASRVLAARRLLTEAFFYRLDHNRLEQVLGITQMDAITWDRLANLGQPDAVRKRAAMLMDVGEWTAAAASLDALPVAERSPEDLTARASLALVQGDVSGALSILQPAADTEERKANVYLHPDRWQKNVAAQAYYLLQGDLAQRDGRQSDAETAYDQAAEYQSGSQSDATSVPQSILKSPLSIADTGSLYVTSPEVTRDDERTLTITAAYSGARPYRAYPLRTWRVQVVSPDSTTRYAEAEVPVTILSNMLISLSTTVTLPSDIPSLTPALVIVEPRYNNAVTVIPAILPVVLSRPDAVAIPPDAEKVDFQFASESGTQIVLQGYQVQHDSNSLKVTLYWKTDSPPPVDYQVFVHVLDANGQQVGGQDSAPVNNQYPTSQWRTGVTIADPHVLTFDTPLASGQYTIQIGLYHLPEGARLTIAPTNDRVHNNSLQIAQFQQR